MGCGYLWGMCETCKDHPSHRLLGIVLLAKNQTTGTGNTMDVNYVCSFEVADKKPSRMTQFSPNRGSIRKAVG